MTDKKHQHERLPPDNPDVPGRSYDSIFAETGVAPGMTGNGGQKHNEYVVFHPDASYPEYIVHYTVSTPGIACTSAVSPAVVPLDVQAFLSRVGLDAWTPFFAKHLEHMVKTVQLAKKIDAKDLRVMADKANMRLDPKTTKQVLNALKK